MKNQRKGFKKEHIQHLIYGVLIIIAVNIIGGFWHTRLDLTQEKRYTLSEATKAELESLEDIVFIRVYLDGDLPAGFQRLRNAAKELLDEFRAYNSRVQYEFINPNESESAREREDTYLLLMEKGLSPTDLTVKTNKGVNQQIIFPGALMTYGTEELPVELLSNRIGTPQEEILNSSIENLEYAFIAGIKNIVTPIKPKVAILSGHGELAGNQLGDFLEALQEQYSVEVVEFNGQINALTKREPIDTVKMDKFRITNKFKTVIIPKPIKPFTEMEKFIIDQFVMRGGNILWLVDPVLADMDSLYNTSVAYGLPLDLNLEDMFFNYGVRLNTDLALDRNCIPIKMVTGMMNNQPVLNLVPWYFFPQALGTTNPISRNINAVKTNFVSSIDTIKVRGITKEILLEGSPFGRLTMTPARIDLNIARMDPQKLTFDKQKIPFAVLLEGEFTSLFKGRVPHALQSSNMVDFVERGAPAKMVVVADGDIIRNQFSRQTGRVLPLGYDQDTEQTYGNKTFLLNAVNYLTEDGNLINVRSRTLKIRLLDQNKIRKQRIYWQLLNVVLPILLVLLYGLFYFQWRKRHYRR